MKKLFSLALVMMMITSVFAVVGCNGLWGFDDDDDVVTPPGIAWNIKGNVNLGDVDGLNLRAVAVTTDYSVLEANVYRLPDNVKMTATAFPIAADGTFTVSFTDAAVGTYSVRITHKTIANFYLDRIFNQTLNNNANPVAVDVTSTAVAKKALEDTTVNPVNDYDTLKNDLTVLAYAKAYEDSYLIVVTTGEGTIAADPIVAVTGVSLNATTKSLNKTETFQLVPTLTPANPTVASVTWSSSNTAVATVSNTGLITAIGGGNANITVTTVSGLKTAACAVTVVVPVTGVTLDKATHTMPDGTNVTLVATVAPADATNKTVTWTSSDATVATVSDAGLVTALKPGVTTITATSAADNTKSAACAVTVTAVAVTGVTLNKDTTSIVTGLTETLVATIAPANATNKAVTWTTSNAAVATVSNTGVVTAVAAGNANVTVTTTDGSFTDVCAVTVVNSPIAVTGVTLNKNATSIVAGAKETLVATVAPANASNKNVTWTTSNGSVATVSATGEVTAVAVGTANITVTTADGSKTAVCAVTVTAAPVVDRKTVTFSQAVTGMNLGNLQIVIRTPNFATYTNSVVVTYIDATVSPSVEKQETYNKDAALTTQFSEVTLVPSITTPYEVKSFTTLTFAQDLPAGAVVAIFNLDTSADVITYTVPN